MREGVPLLARIELGSERVSGHCLPHSRATWSDRKQCPALSSGPVFWGKQWHTEVSVAS
jgi:hypothetical protein